MEKLIKLGYTEVKETPKYIEFKTNKYSPYERIKISKENFEITKDCKSSQGNRGWRTIKYNELLAINKIIENLKIKEMN